MADHERFLTVKDWPTHYSWPPAGGLRHIIYHAESNGFGPAIKRVGRRVLIDSERFWEIVDSKVSSGAGEAEGTAPEAIE